MATSAVQIAANRSNAQRSTGPRTERGKSASSRNATTTGLTSATMFVRPEEQPAFEELKSMLRMELKPVGETQIHYFGLIIHAQWNIRRCFRLESKIQVQAVSMGLADALLDDELARKLDRIYRYKKMHEASHRRASAELRHLQTECLWRQSNNQNPDEDSNSILVDTAKVTIKQNHSKALKQRASLDAFRRQIEAFIAPPPLDVDDDDIE
ncbi:MAG TPA: hypothetical protein VGL53_30720 [Bryobacteraceae bacterium]|jgi:hypothetical protein